MESYLTGYSDKPADYDIVVENTKTGVGVEQTGDNPLSRFNFWSPRTTICPEAYHHLVIAPGQTATLEYPLSLLCQVGRRSSPIFLDTAR